MKSTIFKLHSIPISNCAYTLNNSILRCPHERQHMFQFCSILFCDNKSKRNSIVSNDDRWVITTLHLPFVFHSLKCLPTLMSNSLLFYFCFSCFVLSLQQLFHILLANKIWFLMISSMKKISNHVYLVIHLYIILWEL